MHARIFIEILILIYVDVYVLLEKHDLVTNLQHHSLQY